MAMTDLRLHADGRTKIIEGNPIQPPRTQRLREQVLSRSDDHLSLLAPNLEDIQGRPGSNSEPLALSDGEVMNAAVAADHLSCGRNQFPSCIRQRLSLLLEIGIEELLVISARNKADFL